jgi:fructose-bisphosphate aldolase class II
MNLVPMGYLLRRALKHKYAVPALNIANLETVKNVLIAANELRAPVIVAVYHGDAYNCGFRTIVEIVRCLGEEMNLEVAVHLDHGSNLEQVIRAIRAGFTSVMYDGSALPIDENIKNTKLVVELAKYAGVTVEAEIGALGEHSLSDPDDAVRLAETGIDCLAVAIGNAHGWYKGECRLDFARLELIAKRTSIPIVLHGGTGIPKEQIQKAISLGIAKVNFGTVLRDRFVNGVKAYMTENPNNTEIRDILGGGAKPMQSAVGECISLCMAEGEAGV